MDQSKMNVEQIKQSIVEKLQRNFGCDTTDATDVFQEGLQFPGIKLFEAGRPVEGLFDLIRANVRTPDATLGDLYACVGALRVGERALREILRRFGKDTVLGAMQALLDEGERRARLELQRLPIRHEAEAPHQHADHVARLLRHLRRPLANELGASVRKKRVKHIG